MWNVLFATEINSDKRNSNKNIDGNRLYCY